MPVQLSVAMPTFNGECFVAEQIESIVTQSPTPDELIVADDGSADRTIARVTEIAGASGVPVRVVGGDHVGLRRNVQRALDACEGSVIVLADQDDVWRPGKLAAVAEAFRDRGVTLWFSDAEIIGEDGALFDLSLWDAVSLDAEDRKAIMQGRGLRRLLHGATITGATMAFRRSVLDVALPFPDRLDGPGHLYLHDGWIAILAFLMGDVVADSRRFIAYRQHRAQVTGMRVTEAAARGGAARGRPRPLTARKDIEDEYGRLRLVLDRLQEKDMLRGIRPTDARKLVDLAALYSARTHPPGPGKSARVIAQLVRGRYHTYSRGLRTAAGDLLPRRG